MKKFSVCVKNGAMPIFTRAYITKFINICKYEIRLRNET